jgi:peptidoglycan/LPS O-acetylase OafA/YrhL
MQEIKSLTSLRFLLAFWVLLYHYQEKIGFTSGAHIDLIQLGYVAVTTFFVLSGFILAINYLSRDKMVGMDKFLQARFSRIYPVYLFSILFSAPFYFFHVLNAQISGLRILLCLVVLAMVLFMLQSWFTKLSTAINIPAWSLSVECFFYLTFLPISRFLNGRTQHNLITVMFLMVTLSIIIPCLLIMNFDLNINSVMDSSSIYKQWRNLVYFIKFNPLIRLPEFVLGVCVGILYNRKHILKIKSLTFLLLFILLGVILYFSRFQIPYLVMHNGLFAIPSACLILSLSMQPDSTINRILSNRILVFFGKCSYALYLIHYSVLNYMLEIQKIINFNRVWLFLICTVVALAASVFMYWWIEEPWRNKLKNKINFSLFPSVRIAR